MKPKQPKAAALPGPKRTPPQRPGNRAAANRCPPYLTDAALAKLDQAAATDLGPPQYFRGLALAGLPPDRGRAEQAVADLEFVLAVADQFPAMLLRAAYHGLAAAHAVLGHDEQAAEAMRKSGLGAAPADTQLMFGGFWATAADGFRFTSPRIPAPGTRYPGRPGL